MRRCPKCGEIMDYDTIEDKWKCSCCGYEKSRVTRHGDRYEDPFQYW